MGLVDDLRRSYRAGRTFAGRAPSSPPPRRDVAPVPPPAEPPRAPPPEEPRRSAAHLDSLADSFSDVASKARAEVEAAPAAAPVPPPAEPPSREEPRPEKHGGGDGRQEPQAFDGDALAECKAVLAGYVEQNAGLTATIEQWRVAVAERDERIVTLVGERDEACAERDRGQAAVTRARAQIGELESIIAFPGVRNALRKALHPDTGAGGDVSSRTEIFKTLNVVLARLGGG